jgi:hypothetical protein
MENARGSKCVITRAMLAASLASMPLPPEQPHKLHHLIQAFLLNGSGSLLGS